MRNGVDFDPGFDIRVSQGEPWFSYGEGVFGPKPELRTLDSIRASLKDPACKGPEVVYAIVMDVGKSMHKELLQQMHLLYGAVTYAQGKLGNEPVRSQGHMHKISAWSRWSTPEVYEIWSGKAVIYMQETADSNDPGRCYAVVAGPGDVVIVPPYWVHATISADPKQSLTFGAWCDRDYGFVYEGVRSHKGIAWFPTLDERNELVWEANDSYGRSELIIKSPGDYTALGIVKGEPIYTTFEKAPDTFAYVPQPALKKEIWENFVP